MTFQFFFCLKYIFLSSLSWFSSLVCWLHTFKVRSLLWASLPDELFINCREAVVLGLATSTLTELFVPSCYTSSFTLMVSSAEWNLQTFQVQHLLHLYVILQPVLSLSSNIFCSLTSKLSSGSASLQALTLYI